MNFKGGLSHKVFHIGRFLKKVESLNLSNSSLSFCQLHTGLSSLGVPGVPWHTQILADQLTLLTDYAPLITTGTPGFSDLPTALT